MRVRIETGSDIARLGAWDAATAALPPDANDSRDQATAAATTRGDLFVINTGADGSDTIDVFVDESPTPAQLQGFRRIGKERLLRLPSGKLRVDGLESYRIDTQTAPANDLVDATAGDYGITCWVNADKEIPWPTVTSETLRSAVGEADHEYYRKTEQSTYLGCGVGVLLLPLLWLFLGWKTALAIAVVVLVGWPHTSVAAEARYFRHNP